MTRASRPQHTPRQTASRPAEPLRVAVAGGDPRLCDRSGLLRSTALQAVAYLMVSALPFGAMAQPAQTARPTGGQVVAGQASIAQTPAQTTINQASQRAAVNWQGFDVGSQHSVQFQQPSASSVTLNRVVGPNPSEIAGRIQANGQVVVVNQAGVLFHKGAQVDTAGLVVSAAGISNSNFMAGRMVFDQPARPGARIENRGTITIKEQGLAALVAPQVANSGVIRAKMGKVILAGAEAHTLDLYGDGLLSINVTRQVQSKPGNSPALVTNTGTVSAAGGTVVLTAEAVDGVVTTLVNAGGRVAANTRNGQTGRVVVSGRGGDVTVAGTVTADGNRAGQNAGAIAIAPTGQVKLASSARVSATGQAGGGSVAIGVPNARTANGPSVAGQVKSTGITVQQGATIAADARQLGRGGTVTLLSSGTTRMDGAISAQGGAAGGDGGFVEVSGRVLSSVSGRITVSAPAGRHGSILLDPDFLDIVDAAANTGSQDGTFGAGKGTILAADKSIVPDTISNGVLNAFEGDVLLQANKTITVAGNVSLTKQPNLSLTLEAGGTITVNAGIVLQASGDIILATGGAGPSSPPTAQASPLISVLGTIASTSGTVSLLGGTNGTISIGSAGAITGAGAALSSLNAGSIVIAGSVDVTGALALSSGTGGIAVAGSGKLLGTTVALAGNGAITLAAGSRLGRSDSAVDLSTTGGGISQTNGGTIIAATLRSASAITGDVSLISSTNTIGTVGSFAANGGTSAITLINSGSLAIDGPVSAPGTIGIRTGGAGRITVNGTIASGGAMVLFSGTGGVALNGGAVIDADRIGIIGPGGSLALAAGSRLGLGGSLLDIRMDAGGIQQDPASTIAVTTLQSSAGIAGSVSLAGTANAIGRIGTFGVSGAGSDFLLRNAGTLAINGALTVPNNVTVIADGASTITTTSAITAGGTLSLSAGGGYSMSAGTTLSAPTVRLEGGGAIAIGSGVTIGQAGGLVDLGTSAGGVTQAADAVILAGTLLSTAGVTGSAALLGSANSIATLGSFAVTGADADFALVNAGTLAIDKLSATRDVRVTGGGAITAGDSIAAGRTLALTSTGGGIALTGSAILTGPTIALSAANAITLADGARLGQAGGIVDLSTTADGIDQAVGATLVATTLRSASGVAGSVSLIGTANAIETVAGFAVSGSNADFRLQQTGTLAVTGPLTAPRDIVLASGTGGRIVASGSIGAGRTLSLAAGSLGIALNAGAIVTGPTILATTTGPISLAATARLGQAGALVDLSTSAGGIAQDPGATIVAGTLQSSAGISGSVALAGTANAIGGIGTFAVSGANADFSLLNTGSVAIAGPLTAPRDIALSSTSIGASGSITAGRTLALTAAGGGVSLDPGAVISAPTIAIAASGAVTLAAGAILGRSGAVLDISTSAGGITQDPGATIVAATLLSSAGVTGAVSLAGVSNSLGTLAGFGVSGADADFLLIDAGVLRVAGTLSATRDIRIATETLVATGAIAAGRTLALNVIGGSLTLEGGAALAAPAIALSAGGPITLNAGAVLGQDGSAISLSTSAGGIVQDAGAVITAASLRSSNGVAGAVSLTGTANAIGTIGTFVLSGAGSDFFLLDTGNLAIAGPLTAPRDITLITGGTGTITASGSIGAGQTLSLTSGSGGIALGGAAILTGPTIVLDGNGGAIALASGARLGQSGGLVDLTTTGGDIDQNAGAVITAGLLRSTKGVSGSVSLAGTANAIDRIGSFEVSGAGTSFLLVDTNDLTVAGRLAAPLDIDLTAGTLVVSGTIAAGGSALLTAGAGGIALDGAAVVTGATIALDGAGPITLASGASLGQAGALVDLSTTSGGIEQDAGATIIAGVLRSSQGVSGDVALRGIANDIGTLGGFAVAGETIDEGNQSTGLFAFGAGGSGFTLVDTGDLLVSGPVTAPGIIDIATSGTGRITAAGSIGAGESLTLTSSTGGIALTAAAIVTGPVITLAGGGGPIALASGSVLGQDGASIALQTSAGGIDQAAGGTIIAGTLSGSAGGGGAVSLAGTTNAIETLADFTAGGNFFLLDATALAVTGQVTGATVEVGAAALTVTGAVTATTGLAALGTTSGSLSQSGTVSAVTAVILTAKTSLVHDGTTTVSGGGGSASLFAGDGELRQSGTLMAAGPVLLHAFAGDIIHDGFSTASAGAMAIKASGTISQAAGAIRATGGSIDLNAGVAILQGSGAIGATDGAVHLTSSGSITQSGGAIGATNGAVTLSATGNISIAGNLDAQGTGGAVSVTSKSGDVAQSGTIVAATSAKLSAGREVTNTGGVSAGTIVTLTAGTGLTNQGAVSAGTDASLTASTDLANTGGIAAGAAAVLLATSGTLVQDGVVTAATSVTQRAVAGSLRHGGATTAGSGPATIQAGGDLAQTGGTIQSIASTVSLAAGGSLTQSAGLIQANGSDGRVGLSAGGDVSLAELTQATGSGGAVTIAAVAGALTQSGTIVATTTIGASAGTNLSNSGRVQAGTDASLSAGATLTNAGGIVAGSAASFKAGGAVGNTGTMDAGSTMSIAAGTSLVNDGRIAAGTESTLTAGTSLTNSAGMTAGTALSLSAGAGLSNSGGLSSGTTASLTAGTNLTNSGAMTAGTALFVSAGAGLDNNGGLSSGTTASLTAGTNLTNSGTMTAGIALALSAGAGLDNSGGLSSGTTASLTAGTNLTNSGSVTAGTSLSLSAGAGLDNTGGLSSATTASLNAGTSLTNSGRLTAGSSAALTAGGNLTNTGSIGAGADATLVATAGSVTQAGALTAGGALVLRASAGTVEHSGSTAGGGGIAIDAAGDIVQTEGTIQATGGEIRLSAGRSILQSAGLIRTLGSATAITLTAGGTGQSDGIIQAQAGTILANPARGTIGLSAANRIELAGLVTATDPGTGVIDLQASGRGSSAGETPAIAIPGIVTAGQRLTQQASNGDIALSGQLTAGEGGVTIQADAGSVRQTAGTVAGGTVSMLAPSGVIQQAGAVTAATAATLAVGTGLTQTGLIRVDNGTASLSTTGGALVQSGSIAAGRIVFADIGGPITISGTLTGLLPSRLQSQTRFAIPQADFPTPGNDTGIFITAGAPGVDTGTKHAITFNASARATSGLAQLVVAMANNDPAVVNVNATNVDLFLELLRGPATGNVFVSSLHVGYQPPGTTGEVALQGVIRGQTGQDAAPASFIQPLLKSNYMINGCAIQSITCVQITTLRLPVDNPLKNVQTGQSRGSLDVYVILPDVAERDY